MPPAEGASVARMPPGYEFVRMLGTGGSGSVALARHTLLDRLVAIKTVYAGRYVEAEVLRLEREGKALARLDDERIVSVYALDHAGDDLALVLEYVAGGDLRRALDDGTLSGTVAKQALLDTAGALAQAAAAGIVHRDVKPANVLLTTDGRAKLADFGIARLAATAGAFRTGGKVVIGTPRYMAPEQIEEPDLESPRADAYSFAVMAYEVLLGRPPFDAVASHELLEAHRSSTPPRPRDLRPTLSRRAELALLSGLAKNPEDRPTPVELMAELPDAGEDWSLPARRRTQPPQGSATETGPAAGDEPLEALQPQPPRTVQLTVPDVPWLEPAAAAVRSTSDGTRRLSPVVVGVVAGILVVLVVLLLLP